ncbi:uncharacterized protein [Leptinotarsa decemlineata]|uniref:uncharacterized protein n=1 Tax=Leptinotarsa decemlineata TaxID=7539 RepID=UPI003D3083A3
MVSAEALCAIAGIPPIDLLVQERGRIDEANVEVTTALKKRERLRTIEEWQLRWDRNNDKAQWTKRLIPHLGAWTECRQRRTGYFLTQFLSGHGSFRVYTNRIGKANDNLCIYCKNVDIAEHTIFECLKWASNRHRFEMDAGRYLTPDNIVQYMLGSTANYELTANYISTIMKKKETEERESQAEEKRRQDQR